MTEKIEDVPHVLKPIDGGGIHVRHGAGRIDISDPARKAAIVKRAGRYFAAAGLAPSGLKSDSKIARTIRNDDVLLTASLRIGDVSVADLVIPLLDGNRAAEIAYILLKCDWPVSNIETKLAALQSRFYYSENTPLFNAAKIISSSHDEKEKKNRLSPTKEIGVCIAAFTMADSGVHAVSLKTMRAAVNKKHLPDPTYTEFDAGGT